MKTLSIPYSSDKTIPVLAQAGEYVIRLSIPYSSDKTKYIPANLGTSQNFLSHIVQIKLSSQEEPEHLIRALSIPYSSDKTFLFFCYHILHNVVFLSHIVQIKPVN